MPSDFTRIISDIHFGDHASSVHRLAQLRPLLTGVERLIINGDTIDCRPGPFPEHTAACRAAALEFFPREVGTVTFVSGNHDASFSPLHHLDLAGGEVYATHGDVFFDDIVPWSRDAVTIGRLIAQELGQLPPAKRDDLEHRLAVFRRVAAAIPQRHQAEPNRLKYLAYYLLDTVWPPLRTVRILRAWQLAPVRAMEFARRYRPAAKFIVSGHTHRPGVWRYPTGVTTINTGSFCPPLGGCCVDLVADRLIVRTLERRRGDFHPGAIRADFRLGAAGRTSIS